MIKPPSPTLIQALLAVGGIVSLILGDRQAAITLFTGGLVVTALRGAS
jgi:hypothetical protein